jgi:hypothetical protein
MPLPTAQMPAAVPDWLVAPHDLALGLPVATVPFITGAARMRRVAVGITRTLAAEMLLTQAQAEAAHGFMEDDLQAATLPFSARTLAADGARAWWHARFASPARWTAVPAAQGPLWRLQATLRLEGEPSTTGPA